jgi:hypothetical protein
MTCNAYLGSGTTTDDHGIRDGWGLGLLGPSNASSTITLLTISIIRIRFIILTSICICMISCAKTRL